MPIYFAYRGGGGRSISIFLQGFRKCSFFGGGGGSKLDFMRGGAHLKSTADTCVL